MESSRLGRVSGTDLSEMEADIDLAQAGEPALIGDARRPLPHAVVGLPRKFEVGPVDREPFVERSVGQHRAIGASVPAALGAPSHCQPDLMGQAPAADLLGQVDLAIRDGRGHWDGLEARLLFGETVAPAASPELAARIGRGAGAGEMLRFPLLPIPTHRNGARGWGRSEEHTSALQSLMRISYAVLCLKKKNRQTYSNPYDITPLIHPNIDI